MHATATWEKRTREVKGQQIKWKNKCEMIVMVSLNTNCVFRFLDSIQNCWILNFQTSYFKLIKGHNYFSMNTAKPIWNMQIHPKFCFESSELSKISKQKHFNNNLQAGNMSIKCSKIISSGFGTHFSARLCLNWKESFMLSSQQTWGYGHKMIALQAREPEFRSPEVMQNSGMAVSTHMG